jgi:hypothetical protein
MALNLVPETGTCRRILKVMQRPSQKKISETRWGKIRAESSLFFLSCTTFYVEEELKFPNSS